MKRKVFFRADASQSIGCGHFVRTLALAEMLKDDFDCTFFTQSPTAHQIEAVNHVCKLVTLPADDAKFELFLNYLSGDVIVVLDNYFFSSDYQQSIKATGAKLICFGTNDRHYYSDVLINYAESRPEIFSVEPYTQVKLGLDWVILREPFRHVPTNAVNRRLQRVVICFGGTDQFGLTEKTVDVINKLDEKFSVSLVAADGFGKKRLENLEKIGVDCHVNVSAEQLVELFCNSDYLIASASTITHEGLACRIPVICGYYVENQRRMYQYFMENQLVIGLDDMLSREFPSLLSRVLKSIDVYKKGIRPYAYGNIENRYIALMNSL